MRLILLAAILPILIGAALLLFRAPRNDRHWEPALARPPLFEESGETTWTIRDLRAFEFGKNSKNEAWRDQEIDVGDLTEIWFFIEPFEAWDGVAHSLLSFVFAGDAPQTLSVSVEARREQGETYSGFRGAFNAYELIYVWSSEKDILSRIAVSLNHDVYAYRLDVTPEQARAILEHFIIRTNALYERPRFYNTLVSNCTNELAKAVNDAFPGALPWHYAHVLTGRSAKRLHALGFIDPPETPFAAINERAEIGDLLRAHADKPENQFTTAWRSSFLARAIEPNQNN